MARRNRRRRRSNGRGNGTITSTDLVRTNNIMRKIGAPPRPPQLVTNVVIRRVFRFFNTNAVTNTSVYTITPCKLGALTGIGQTSTVIAMMYEAVRIHSITMWSAADTNTTNTGPPPMCSIEWAGSALGIAGPSFVESDYAVGATKIAIVKSRPNPQTQAGQWQGTQNTNTAAWFVLTMSGQTIIDVECSVVVPSTTRSANTVTVSGPATVGQIYYLALDNNAGGSGSVNNNLVPENSLITIT